MAESRLTRVLLRLGAGLTLAFIYLPLILIATTYDEFGSRWSVAPMVVAVITMGGVFYAYLWDRTGSVWPVSMAHGAVNIAFGIGAGAVVAAGSESDLAYVAGESGGGHPGLSPRTGRAGRWRPPAGPPPD